VVWVLGRKEVGGGSVSEIIKEETIALIAYEFITR